MSKGDSHLFPGTSGEGRALIDEVIANGDKISPDDVVMITRDHNGKIVWLETGNDRSGLQHILNEHGTEFNGKGIANDDIPNYVLEAVCCRSTGQAKSSDGIRIQIQRCCTANRRSGWQQWIYCWCKP